MPTRLALHALSTPQIHLDDKPVTLERRKAFALLVYLALERGSHSREALSALLWPDVSQSNAFKNLRQVLWEIQKTMGEGWLVTDHGNVGLNDTQVWFDVHEFVSRFNEGCSQRDIELRLPVFVDAARLYRNHFLAGFTLKDAHPFNDWAFAEAEDLRHKLSIVLSQLSEDYCLSGKAAQAIPHARRLVAFDPLNEAAHRQLMEVYLQAGQQSAALKQYQECEQILRKELHLDPQPETRELYKKIRKGEMKPVPQEENDISPSLGAAPTDLPTGTVTFLFTDIEGSTKLATQYPDSLPALLKRHQEILSQSVQTHHGYVFQVVADSISAAFHSPNDALHAALEAQRSLQGEAWTPAPIKVRMAVHTGTAELRATANAVRYSSYTTLAIAQRILSTAHGGQVLVSQATHELTHGILPEGAVLRDLGEYQLKDFTQSRHIYQLVIPGLVNDFPLLRISNVPQNNLPIQLSTFIGRERERSEVVDLIGGNPLVTLLGPGGIGKTRLSLESAREMLNSFPGGVWFIELASLSDPDRVTQAVLTTLGLIEQTGRPLLKILIDFLQVKRALLVLDNCEHLIQACAQLAQDLLSSCPDLHVLATSREALGIPGEALYVVPALATPDPLHATLETLSAYEAIQLFVERAQATRAGFHLTEENFPAIAQLCYHLDGIPLAIELAAARVKLLSVEEIAARLDDRFRLLRGGARTDLPRHQTLQALIDWSYDLLSEPERSLLRRLSVFAGGWTLEAAEQVMGDPGPESRPFALNADTLQTEDILDLLTFLVNKSLITVQRKPGQETRYDMLETIRQYARAKLWQAGEAEQLLQRHLAYYVDLAERAEPNLRAPDMVKWLDRLEDEHDNIRSALEWGLESDIEAGLRLASALLWFWHIRGHKNEGVEWLERALSIEAMDQDSRPLTPRRGTIRGKALNASGSLMVMNHEYGKAPPCLEESLAIFRELGPAGKQGMAYALLRFAQLPSEANRAESMMQESLALFREIGDKFGMAEALMQLAGVVKQTYDQAVRFVEEELALSRELGDQDGIAVALANLGDLALSREDYEQASRRYEESLATFRTVRNFGALSLCLGGHADVFFWQGDYERAAKTYEEALAFAQELSYRFIIAFNLYSLGLIAWFQGDYERATHQISNSHPMFRDIGHDWLTVSSLHALGDIALAVGDEERATQWYEEELARSRETQIEVAHMFALHGLGKVAWAKGNYALAASRLEETLRMSREADIKQAKFHSLYSLGRVAQSQGMVDQAHALFIEALGLQQRRVSPLLNWVWLKTYSSAIAFPLAGMAVLAAGQNEMRRAARLFGAAESLYLPLCFEMSVLERAEHDRAKSAARLTLGEETFSTAYNEGKNMPLNETIKYAVDQN